MGCKRGKYTVSAAAKDLAKKRHTKGTAIIPAISEIAGAVGVEASRGITIPDYLAWARLELTRLYAEAEAQRRAAKSMKVSADSIRADAEAATQMAVLLREVSRNVAVAARAAAEIRSASAASYRTDPAFVALWRTLQEVLIEFPEAAARLEELVKERALNNAIPA